MKVYASFAHAEARVCARKAWYMYCRYSKYLKIHCAFTFCGHNGILEHYFNSMLYLEVLGECRALSLGNGVVLGPSFLFFFFF